MPLRGDSSLECQEAREMTRAFLSGGGALERRAEWRAHLAACKECDEQYHDTVEMLSRLHRARRDGAAPADGPAESAQSASDAPPDRRSLIAFTGPRVRVGWRPRKRGGWLGLALPCVALLVLGIIGLPGEEPRAATALALSGAVEVDGRLLGTGDPARALARGSMIVVGESARVRVQDARGEFVLAGEGALRCEGYAPLRARLYGGRLEALGECTVSTAAGVLQSGAGALEVRIDEQGLHVRAGSPGASFQDGNGRRALEPGVELQLATPAAGR
jgi:hypothetical protein